MEAFFDKFRKFRKFPKNIVFNHDIKPYGIEGVGSHFRKEIRKESSGNEKRNGLDGCEDGVVVELSRIIFADSFQQLRNNFLTRKPWCWKKQGLWYIVLHRGWAYTKSLTTAEYGDCSGVQHLIKR